jgi:hypothetical protein
VIQIYLRLASASDVSEGRTPKDWNRPIIEKYINMNYIEHPKDQNPTTISINEAMIDSVCNGTCKIIVGILC